MRKAAVLGYLFFLPCPIVKLKDTLWQIQHFKNSRIFTNFLKH